MRRGLFFLILGSIAAGVYFWMSLPDVSVLKTRYPVILYRASDHTAEIELRKTRPAGWVGLSGVSRLAVDAIVISEDWAFYQHHGYDLNQIEDAMRTDWDRGRFAHGASTITQQVVRNVFLSKEKSLWRKLKELYLATRLDRSVKKTRILEIYLNIAEWGPGVYGINRASFYYFKKKPSELTAKEGAFLAMLLPSPIRYGESFRKRQLTDYASETIRSILRKMTEAHLLTEQEESAEWAQPLNFESHPMRETLKSDSL